MFKFKHFNRIYLHSITMHSIHKKLHLIINKQIELKFTIKYVTRKKVSKYLKFENILKKVKYHKVFITYKCMVIN